MENAIYIGLSRQIALGRQMGLIANNVANINTTGFRADKVLFEEYISRPNPGKENITQVFDYGQFKVENQGPMKSTGRPLDVALDGPAFIPVETSEGTKYTRAGNFSLNNNSELVTTSGNHVLDNGDKTITFPQGTKEIKITLDGTISTEQGVIGKIGMMEFDNPQFLRPTGDGFYVIEGNARPNPATNTKLQQNMLEGSNVQGVIEMTDMIEVSRQYQSMQRLLQTEHDRQRGTIQKLTEA